MPNTKYNNIFTYNMTVWFNAAIHETTQLVIHS